MSAICNKNNLLAEELHISSGYESVVRPSGSAKALYGPGDIYSLLITGKESSNRLFQFEATVPPGGGPPPHIHTKEDESFYIVSGELEVLIGEQWVTSKKGDFAYAPRGIIHAFKNVGNNPAILFVTLTPAGLEDFFCEIFPLVTEENTTPPIMTQEMIDNMNDTAVKYGISYPTLKR